MGYKVLAGMVWQEYFDWMGMFFGMFFENALAVIFW
jgi:hypothetical protein